MEIRCGLQGGSYEEFCAVGHSGSNDSLAPSFVLLLASMANTNKEEALCVFIVSFVEFASL